MREFEEACHQMQELTDGRYFSIRYRHYEEEGRYSIYVEGYASAEGATFEETVKTFLQYKEEEGRKNKGR